jgi:hypothetical protein
MKRYWKYRRKVKWILISLGKYGKIPKLNSEKVWKILNKGRLNSEMMRKIWKKGKSNSEKIWKIWKKSKLNSEKICKIQKKSKLNCAKIWCGYNGCQFSGCWLILSVCIIMSFDFPFVRLFGVRYLCYYPYDMDNMEERQVEEWKDMKNMEETQVE